MAQKPIELPQYPPQKTVRIGDYDIAYFVTGPQNGRPLLFCHGLAASGRQFIADAAYFGDKGFRVIVPDLRGHGNSTGPETRSDEDFSIPRMAADLAALLDAENIKTIDWVGNSLGGILALSLMKSDRDRLNKVITFGTSFALNVPKVWVPIMRIVYGAIGTKLMAQAGAPMTTWQPQAQALVKALLETMDIDAVIRTARDVRHYNLIDNALAFGGPILMIKGKNDTMVNLGLRSTLKAMADQNNFHLLEMAGAGHVANLDQPEKIRAVIAEFLD